ncbi:MAG: hypothetical protein GY765_20170 [bacterium]|nr:hypothetical protein [bacterium]
MMEQKLFSSDGYEIYIMWEPDYFVQYEARKPGQLQSALQLFALINSIGLTQYPLNGPKKWFHKTLFKSKNNMDISVSWSDCYEIRFGFSREGHVLSVNDDLKVAVEHIETLES